jgi:hypothetical protein
MIEYNKALASVGSKSKFILLGAILILWRRITLHKPKPMVLLHRLLCIIGVRTEMHRVDTRTEEPVCLQEVCRYLRNSMYKYEYSQYHTYKAESIDNPVLDRLTKLVATRSITSVLYETPIDDSHDDLIVRVPVFKYNLNTISTSRVMALVKPTACGGCHKQKQTTEVL